MGLLNPCDILIFFLNTHLTSCMIQEKLVPPCIWAQGGESLHMGTRRGASLYHAPTSHKQSVN